MKKSLLALAVFGAFAGTAAAQVTVYGQLEVGYGTRETSDATGAKTVDVRGVQDNVLGASRWGIRGSEDLGNGLKGIFNLENEVNLSGASSMQAGPRLAFVGLQGGFGTITLGRDNNPFHSVAAASDVDGRNGFSPTAQLYQGTNRSNAITYTSPNMGGFTGRLQVSNERNDLAAANADSAKVMALALAYANGPLTIGGAYQDYSVEFASGGNPVADQKNWIIGGAYDLKVVKLFANVQERDVTNGNEDREYNLGVSAPIGAFTVVGGIGRNNRETPAGVKTDGNDYVVGANYSLSKRTFAYVRHGRYNTFDRAEQKGFQVGVRHAF